MSENYTVQLETPPAIIETDSRRSDDVRKRVQEIDSSVSLGSLEWADLFAEIKDKNYWHDWKYESFNDYIKQSNLDLSARKIAYLITTSKVSKLLKIDKALIVKARPSKVDVIFTLDPNATVLEPETQTEVPMGDIIIGLIRDAPNKKLAEIKEIVAKLKGVVEEDSSLTWLNLPCRRDAKAIVIQAIELASALNGPTVDIVTKAEKEISMAAGLEKVAADFLASPDNQLEPFEDEGDLGDFADSTEDMDEDTLDA
jgi:hypothetical protein